MMGGKKTKLYLDCLNPNENFIVQETISILAGLIRKLYGATEIKNPFSKLGYDYVDIDARIDNSCESIEQKVFKMYFDLRSKVSEMSCFMIEPFLANSLFGGHGIKFLIRYK